MAIHAPQMSDPHVASVLVLLVVSVALFIYDRIPLAVVSLGLLSSLVALFSFFPLIDPASGAVLLDAERLLSGFSNPAVIIFVALLVVGEGVTRTGALAVGARLIRRASAGNWRVAIALSLFVVAVASAFVNNAPVVVIFIPILMVLAEEMGERPSKILMPLSFAAILGGNCSLIGSANNIIIAEYAAHHGIARLEMFSFTKPAVILLVVGLVYIIAIMPRLLPDNVPALEGMGHANDRQFTAQLKILPHCVLKGRSMEETMASLFKDVHMSQLIRGDRVFWPPFDGVHVEEGDLLIVMGNVEDLKKLEWSSGSTLSTEMVEQGLPEAAVSLAEQTLAEVVVTPDSSFVGRTIEQIHFRERFGAAVIAIQRNAMQIRGRITQLPLRGGDLLLIQGTPIQLQRLAERTEFFFFWGAQEAVVNRDKAPVAAGILVGIVLLSALGVADMLALSLGGAFMMLISRCLSVNQAAKAVSPNLVLLIVAALALGMAMQVTGTAQALAVHLVNLTQGLTPWMVLAVMILMVSILTNLISNNATAILFLPVAVELASTLGVSSMPFLMAVLFGANAAFSSPIGYKTNLLVMSAGGYCFRDFARAGLPLNIIIWLLSSLLIPLFWPF